MHQRARRRRRRLDRPHGQLRPLRPAPPRPDDDDGAPLGAAAAVPRGARSSTAISSSSGTQVRAADHRPLPHALLVEPDRRRMRRAGARVTPGSIRYGSGFQRNEETSYSGSPSNGFGSIAKRPARRVEDVVVVEGRRARGRHGRRRASRRARARAGRADGPWRCRASAGPSPRSSGTAPPAGRQSRRPTSTAIAVASSSGKPAMSVAGPGALDQAARAASGRGAAAARRRRPPTGSSASASSSLSSCLGRRHLEHGVVARRRRHTSSARVRTARRARLCHSAATSRATAASAAMSGRSLTRSSRGSRRARSPAACRRRRGGAPRRRGSPSGARSPARRG